MYSYHSYSHGLTGRHHMMSPIHPDLGPIVCYVSYRRSKDVKGRIYYWNLNLIIGAHGG